jgi:phospholipase C
MNRLFSLALAALCLTAPASAQITSFQHIILVVQENRTPDNLFYGLCTTPSACSTRPGPKQYNIQTAGGWTKPRPPRRPISTPFRWASATTMDTVTPTSLPCAI